MDLVHPAVGLVAEHFELARQAFADLAGTALDLAPVTGLNAQPLCEPAFETAQCGGVRVLDGVVDKLVKQRQSVVQPYLRQIDCGCHCADDKTGLPK